MNALEEQRKQLLGWMMQYPPKPLEERLARSYHAMNPAHEVVQARTTTATEVCLAAVGLGLGGVYGG